jgi:TolB-like protein/DNA-binding winged helix-turn-helix (wHTH) protein/Tfp pilus assembly protein PilF
MDDHMAVQRFRLGNDYELDLGAYELRRSGRPLKLPRIPMEVLRLLIEQRGLLVTRAEIVERIWGKDVALDTDNSINAAIRKIRQALRDDPERPEFLQTVPAMGYRFIAEVVELDPPAPAQSIAKSQSSETAPEPEPGGATPAGAPSSRGGESPLKLRRPGSSGWRLIVALVLALAAAGGYFLWSRSRSQPQPAGGRLMLAVLPFENLTGDSGQEYFSDGLTEEVINELGRLNPEHLGVIGRTSVMFYKSNPKPVDQIGRELGVQYVLEGSVRRDADKVRITAQLIQVKDQTHLWSHEYDRELKDVLLLQGEIARETSDEIQTALGERRLNTSVSRPALSQDSYEAYNLYLKGQYFWNKRTPEDFRQAIHYFQQATTKNPNYAPAYAGLADSYALIGGYSGVSQAEFIGKARAAALRALELDDKLPEAHTALALIVQNYDWDWQTAEKEYRRAIELNPNYATAHHWYAEHLTWRGRFDEAFRESERARQLDPLSLIIAADYGVMLYFDRQYDRAIEQFRAVREMDPSFSRSRMILYAYLQKGMYQEALTDLEKARLTGGEGVWYWATLADVCGRAGRVAQAQRALDRALELNRQQQVDASYIAGAYLGVGHKDEAIAWLEKGYAQHSNTMATLKVEPAYDPLRSDPRFQDLLRRVGLAQ